MLPPYNFFFRGILEYRASIPFVTQIILRLQKKKKLQDGWEDSKHKFFSLEESNNDTLNDKTF